MRSRITHIYLIGFSGAGKSTVGKALAAKLNRPFVDIDCQIKKKQGKSVPAIFADDGEKKFRKMETAMIKEVSKPGRVASVIALGGGGFASEVNRAIIIAVGKTVWLSCSVREIYRRLRHESSRPLLNVRQRSGESRRSAVLQKITSLVNKRKLSYRLADYRVATSNKPISVVVSEIITRIKE